jgi:hypothetical protein
MAITKFQINPNDQNSKQIIRESLEVLEKTKKGIG